MRFLFTLFIITLLFWACSSNEEFTGYERVDVRLWYLFESFEEEGRLRGLEIDLRAEGITAEISEIASSGVAGLCQFVPELPNAITIDATFWANSSAEFKEFVVFHELGHCFLDRGHLEDSFSNGSCVSIMRSGLGSCEDNYSPSTRAEYLDELFLE